MRPARDPDLVNADRVIAFMFAVKALTGELSNVEREGYMSSLIQRAVTGARFGEC